MSRKLVRLRDRYPTASRMTRWRLCHMAGFPTAVNLLGTQYYYDDELEAYEEAHRRLTTSEAETEAQ